MFLNYCIFILCLASIFWVGMALNIYFYRHHVIGREPYSNRSMEQETVSSYDNLETVDLHEIIFQ